jgi:protein-tyrosine-phosphatase
MYPEVVEAMAEIGLDLTEAAPLPVTPADIVWADLVVTIDCPSEVGFRSTGTLGWTVPEVERDPTHADAGDPRRNLRAGLGAANGADEDGSGGLPV